MTPEPQYKEEYIHRPIHTQTPKPPTSAPYSPACGATCRTPPPLQDLRHYSSGGPILPDQTSYPPQYQPTFQPRLSAFTPIRTSVCPGFAPLDPIPGSNRIILQPEFRGRVIEKIGSTSSRLFLEPTVGLTNRWGNTWPPNCQAKHSKY